VVIPTLGLNELTRSVVAQLIAEGVADVCVIDNGSTFEDHRITVIRPDDNLGWLRSCNLGMRLAFSGDYTHCIVLNNDVILSEGFVGGLLGASAATGPGVFAPLYDDVWPQQRIPAPIPARDFVGNDHDLQVPFADGTCLMVSREVYEKVGELNERFFAQHGWAADLDFCHRVRLAGFPVIVTMRSYLNHLGRRTAAVVNPGYVAEAIDEAVNGMRALYGADWPELFANASDIRAIYGMPERLPTRPRG